MPHKGPRLNHLGPDDTPVWEWLFESEAGSAALASGRGFHDASTGASLSFRDLKQRAISVSTALDRSYDVKPGQTISIICQNSIEYPVVTFAALRLGAVVSALPHEAKAKDLAYYLRTSSAALVYADSGSMDEVRQACQMVGLDSNRIVSMDGSSEGSTSLQQLMEAGSSSAPVEPWKPKRSPARECAMMCFSSGTTGLPKAVMISHSNMIAQLRQVHQFTPSGRQYTVLGILPFYHITGLIHFLQLPIVLNQNLVVMAKFDMREMLETVVKYRCTELWLVPPLLIRLLNDPVVNNYDLSFVKQFNTGAAPLPEQVVSKLATKFPHVALRQGWGMTESTSCLTITPPHLCTWENAAKVGTIAPGTEVKIVDPETGKEVGLNQTGELWTRGPQVAMGYLDNSKATAETFDAEGYLHTGDLGAIDEEGFVTIHDRIKEMIKVRGHGVAPAELEDLILGYESVSDAAVIGIPDDYSGELPMAYVVVKPGFKRDQQTAKQIQDFVKKNKPREKRLAGGIEFVDAIPKSASGKILRRVLRLRWKEKANKEDARAKL